MPAPAVKTDEEGKTLPFYELDKVRLTKAITAKGRRFSPGLVGTVVYCHGKEAYEIEFPKISDFFQMPAGYLEKV